METQLTSRLSETMVVTKGREVGIRGKKNEPRDFFLEGECVRGCGEH